MKAFAQLFSDLDQSNNTNAKATILKRYFAEAPDQDKLWTLALFTHKRPKRQVNTALLRTWASEVASMPEWLFQESHDAVGDLAETIALLLPPPTDSHDQSLSKWIDELNNMQNKEEAEKKAFTIRAWSKLNREERLVFNKLITGGFRIGVSQNLMVRAMAEQFDIDKSILAHRITGNWTPHSTTFEELILSKRVYDDDSKSYPFNLTNSLETKPNTLGVINDWQVEWKWDGIRGQIIIRNEEVYVWSHVEELVTEKFPELHQLKDHFPNGTVLDGEILPFKDGKPLPFALLQTRIGRKNLTKNTMQKVPIHFMVYDIMECEEKDYRQHTMQERRAVLASLFVNEIPSAMLSPPVEVQNWNELAVLRESSRQGSQKVLCSNVNLLPTSLVKGMANGGNGKSIH